MNSLSQSTKVIASEMMKKGDQQDITITTDQTY